MVLSGTLRGRSTKASTAALVDPYAVSGKTACRAARLETTTTLAPSRSSGVSCWIKKNVERMFNVKSRS